MEIGYLSLGSNMGDKQDYLRQAVNLLGKHSEIIVDQQSAFYQTSPVGGVEQDDFVNVAVRILTTLTAENLLDYLHQIEQQLNRVRKIHWGPRTIDIDIIFFGQATINEPNLVVPHPEALKRRFVVEPILSIMPTDDKHYATLVAAQAELAQNTEQVLHEVSVTPIPAKQIESAVGTILTAVGEDPTREGLVETPARVAKMYAEILSSQRKAKFDEYKLFKIEPGDEHQVVMMKDIPFYSMCEHHMLPFFGQVHVAYLPNEDGQIIGLSKIPRLVDYVTHKLTVQENVTREIAETLDDIVLPRGVAVVVEARHMCVEMRGIRKPNSVTRTTFFTGVFADNQEQRQAFLEAIK